MNTGSRLIFRTRGIGELLPVAGIFAAALALTGCVAPPAAQPSSPDPRLEQLLTAMDQSLENQARVAALLVEQEAQLELQQEQLQSLNTGLGETRAIISDSTAPAPVRKADCPKPQKRSTKMVVGEYEKVWFPDVGVALAAKVDTGAETASLDARNIELFERDGKRWVRFNVVNPKNGEMVEMERRLRRMVGIVKANNPKSERRPVVKLDIIVGHIEQTAEFTLTDRSHLDHQVMLGRNILQDVMVVDVSKSNLAPYVIPKDKAAAGSAQ